MNHQRLEELIIAWEENCLTEEELAEFKQFLSAEPAARQRLVEAGVLGKVAGARVREWALTGQPPVITRPPCAGWLRWAPFAAAAGAALLAVIAWRKEPGGSSAIVPGYAAELSSIDAAVWRDGTPVMETGEHLKPSTMELISGRIELRFMEGAAVVIQGPAKLELLSERRMRLLRGRISADVPARAIGFTVETPLSEVRDLGTRFGVSVGNSGAMETHVFEGEVDVIPKGAASGISGVRRLLAPGALTFSPGGQTPVSIPANLAAFPLPERVMNVPVPCAGFELDAPGWKAGDAFPPEEFNVWGGDHIVRVAAERGIIPKSGSAMLRFMGAMRPGMPVERAGNASELYCWIDLRPLHAQWKGRRVTAEFSTWFNRVSSPHSDLTAPTVIAATYGPGVAPGMAAWETRLRGDHPQHALSNCDAEIRSDADPVTWEQATARVTIAPDAELLLLSVRVRSLETDPAAVRFDDVYADAPVLTFRLGDAIPDSR